MFILISLLQVCRRIDSCPDGTTVLQRIYEGVSVYYNYTGKVDCFDLSDDPHGMGGWDWQVCYIGDVELLLLLENLNTCTFKFLRVFAALMDTQCVFPWFLWYILQACTEMVMPMASAKGTSMFPPYDFNFTSNAESCWNDFHVKPRPTWITTEFGGHVLYLQLYPVYIIDIYFSFMNTCTRSWCMMDACCSSLNHNR